MSHELKELFEMVLNDDVLIPLIGLVLGGLAITFGSVTGMMKHLFRERTRREIAAYIAEGSMTPEQGVELMQAKQKT